MAQFITRLVPHAARIRRAAVPFICGILIAGAFSMPTLTSANSSKNEEIYRQLGLTQARGFLRQTKPMG